MYYKCKQCSKLYATRQSRWKHQQRCRGVQYDQKEKEAIHDYRKEDYQVLDHSESADRSRKPKIQKLVNEDDDDIPTFDGNEFIGKQPVPRKTLYKIMKMLKIPEERWNWIATAEEQDERNSSLRQEEELPFSEQSRSLSDIEITHPVELKLAREPSSSSGDEIFSSDDDDDKRFKCSKEKYLLNRFKVLHQQLLEDRKYENTTELIIILDTLLKQGIIDHAGYRKAFNKVMDNQR